MAKKSSIGWLVIGGIALYFIVKARQTVAAPAIAGGTEAEYEVGGEQGAYIPPTEVSIERTIDFGSTLLVRTESHPCDLPIMYN